MRYQNKCVNSGLGAEGGPGSASVFDCQCRGYRKCCIVAIGEPHKSGRGTSYLYGELCDIGNSPECGGGQTSQASLRPITTELSEVAPRISRTGQSMMGLGNWVQPKHWSR